LPDSLRAHTSGIRGIRANEFEQRASGATYREMPAWRLDSRDGARDAQCLVSDLVKASRRYRRMVLRNGTTTVEPNRLRLTIEDELKILRQSNTE